MSKETKESMKTTSQQITLIKRQNTDRDRDYFLKEPSRSSGVKKYSN
jgi:hypothetical protein